MRFHWWTLGLVAAAVGGSLLLWRRFGPGERCFHFVDDEDRSKNFGAFPPEIPETEFDGANFVN